MWEAPPNYYANYIIPVIKDYDIPNHKPAHVYSLEFHRPLINDEIFEVYKKYELAVHKKEREKDQLARFLCNSPLYDPVTDKVADLPAPDGPIEIGELYEFKDEGSFVVERHSEESSLCFVR